MKDDIHIDSKASDGQGVNTIKGLDNSSTIESLFKEDQEYKMKLASQYDMLSYVGSDIDDVKMDHLTFFKIFHSMADWEAKVEMDKLIEYDTNFAALL